MADQPLTIKPEQRDLDSAYRLATQSMLDAKRCLREFGSRSEEYRVAVECYDRDWAFYQSLVKEAKRG